MKYSRFIIGSKITKWVNWQSWRFWSFRDKIFEYRSS